MRAPWTAWSIAAALGIALITTGCPDDDPADDDSAVGDDDDDGPDLTEPLGADEARAGMLADGDDAAFIGGAAGESRPGDFLLYNDRARFVVRGMRDGNFYIALPGSLIDLDVVRPPAQADFDGVDDLVTLVGLPLPFEADSVRVVADGTDGGAAIVEATGHDTAFGFLDGLLEASGVFPPRGVEVTQTYSLSPGSPALELTTTVTNTTDEDVELNLLDAGMVDLATHKGFIPGAGFDAEEAPLGGRTMMAMVSHRNEQAFAVYRPDGLLAESGMAVLGDEFDLVMVESDVLSLAPGESGSVTRLVGVARDLATLERHRREVQGLTTGAVEGTLTSTPGDAPVAGARVFLTDGDGVPATVAITDGEGRFRVDAEPGAWQLVAVGDGTNERMDFPEGAGHYGIYAHAAANARALAAWDDPAQAVAVPQADGYGRSAPVGVTIAEGETALAELTLTAPGVVSLTVVDGAGTPLPSMAYFSLQGGDPQPADARLGENRPRGGARKVVWLLDGAMDVPLPPGTYDVVAHRGVRYEQARAEAVEVVAGGAPVDIELVLDEAFTIPGWASGDLHTHASPSLDGECTVEERLATAVCNDVQVVVATDHDHISDFRPVVEAFGLGDWFASVPGDEISSELRGHVNAYPLEPDPSLPNGGAPRWWEAELTTDERMASYRELLGPSAMLQANHGLDSGLFASANYNWDTGEPDDPDFYSSNFDTMEILNSGDYGDAEDLREIFCAHLDQGLFKVGTGTSDAHNRLHGSGYARTYVAIGDGAFDTADVDVFFDALRAGRAVVSAGPFVTLTASHDGDEASIGESLEAPSATLAVEVWAPAWMGIDQIRLFGPGCELLDTVLIDGGAVTPPLWFDGEFEVFPEGDDYFFVVVDGWGDMSPVAHGRRPYAMTNPVFVALPG